MGILDIIKSGRQPSIKELELMGFKPIYKDGKIIRWEWIKEE